MYLFYTGNSSTQSTDLRQVSLSRKHCHNFFVLDPNVLQFFVSRNGKNVVDKSLDSDRATYQHQERMV